MLPLHPVPASMAFNLLFIGVLLGIIVAGLAFIRINRKANISDMRDRWLAAAFYGALATIIIDSFFIGVIIVVNLISPKI